MDTLSKYESELKELKVKCAEAEKKVISLESDLRNLEDRKKEYIEKVEQFAGVPYDKAEEVLKQKTEELNKIMAELSTIDFNAETLTDADVKKMENIVNSFSSAKGA